MSRAKTAAPSRLGMHLALLLFALAATACAQRPPVREVARLDPSLPVGRIEGNRFTGIRIPLALSTDDTGWEITTTYPSFMLEQGYEKQGLEESQVFAFNPKTRSNLQISFSPAGPHEVFTQKKIEWLTSVVAGSMASELDAEFGPGKYTATYGKVAPYHLAGVPYAAGDFARYQSGDVKRENGWIYAFAEPFQIFILYQLEDPDLPGDRQDLEKILSSFRYLGPPKKTSP